MKLAAIFTDHMVLQRDYPIALFGEGNGHGTAVINGTVTEFDADGAFLTYLPAMTAGGPYDLTVTIGGDSVTFTDVLVGDVYLAGGQSNMQFRVEESADIPRIPNPLVRHFTEGHFADEDRNAWYDYTPWQVADAEALEKFSAIGYDVGRILCEKLEIPIGIISCNLGASRVDAWTAPEIVETEEYQQLLGRKHWDWHYYKFNQGSWCYLNKLLPIVPYTLCGVLWYQGESNRLEDEAVHYHILLETMIENWRDLWQTDLPFYIVQIAPFADNSDNDWPHIRQAQERVTKEVEGTYLCTPVHTGESDNIHPTKKHGLAIQLASAILAKVFGADLEYCGPVYDTVERTADGVKITFTHAGGLHFDGDPTDLAVFDEAGNPLPYTAAIEGNTLHLTADGISRIELGWRNAPTHNLYNDWGYLASPFRIILGE
ncbi:MAG: hypothetical protein IJN04_04660 [Clostridia bacterium]|nr:hypothetical protein [Clostridia bacterium]